MKDTEGERQREKTEYLTFHFPGAEQIGRVRKTTSLNYSVLLACIFI